MPMSRYALLVGFVAVTFAAERANALATEQLGNKPIGPGWGFDGKLLAAVNMDERVYWYEVNGNPFFFFKGGPKALNEAIRRFAAIPAEKREIILIAGPGRTHTLTRTQVVAYDWCLHVPMGLKLGGDSLIADTRATLTIYIEASRPPAPADPAKVRQSIKDLASDDFTTRAKASRELEAIGAPVAASIREALKDTRSPEARDRLEKVLARVSGTITLDVLELPEGIPVIGVETHLERCRKELSNKDHHVRGQAASGLAAHKPLAAEIVPDLEKVLKTETHEYPLRCAASIASTIGAEAKSLLPALRAGLKNEDKNVQNFFQYAIDAIEKAKPEVVSEAEAKTRAAIRKEIREFIEAREKKNERRPGGQ
jgi:hypothetical protein